MWQASERFFQCWLSSRLKVCEGTHLETYVESEKFDEDILNGREKSYQLVTVCCKYFIDEVKTNWARLQKKWQGEFTSWGRLRSWRSWWGHASMLVRSSNLGKFCTNTNLSLICKLLICSTCTLCLLRVCQSCIDVVEWVELSLFISCPDESLWTAQ